MNASRHYDAIDRLLMRLQPPSATPAAGGTPLKTPPAKLTASERRRVAGLMRINHAGEIAAQALYHGQAAVARNERVRQHLLTAAAEEQAHLQWCAQRLRELDDHPSRLAPFWYAGSFAIGAIAGLAGDRVSLGFVEETERQVSRHLDDHLTRLPCGDARSREVLEAMKHDEERHGRQAREAGGRSLPKPVRRLMWAVSGVMKFGAARF